MTLIANTINFGHPVIIGDILMSSKDSSLNAKIPSFKKGVNNLLDKEIKYYPHYLRQKLYILNDNIAIGLAGSEHQMKLFLEDVKIAFNSIENDAKSIGDYLESYDFTNLQELSYIIIIAEHKENGITISCAERGLVYDCKSDLYEHVYAIGSGASAFTDHLKLNRTINKHNNKSLENTIARNYTLISEILVNERLTLETIKESWGAGFEMIYYDRDKFKKVQDATFVVWFGEFDLNTKKIQCRPVYLINQRYFDDILFITAGDPESFEGFIIPPINREITDEDVKKFLKKLILMQILNAAPL